MNESTQKTVLVVEDVEEIGSEMVAMLCGKGHRVLRARTADEALQIAEHDRPSMILTDMDLPTFDSLVQRVRAHERLKNMLMAIIDINGPVLNAGIDVRVLDDFGQLDKLLASAPV